MKDFNLILAVLGALILGLGLVSRWLATRWLPSPLIALLVGVVLGPYVLGWLDLEAMGNRSVIMEHAARLTLGIGLVGVALRIPRAFPRPNLRELVVVIGLGMPLMWAISTGLVWAILGLPFWIAALIAAAITPTDPVAASTIVTGPLAEEHLPGRVRNVISFDSGANDGLAYLFLFLPFLMLTRPAGEAVRHWLVETLLWEVVVATLAGAALGYGAARALQWAERRDLIQEDWRLIYTVALALLALGAGRLINSDEILLVFAAGVAFVQVVSGDDRAEEEQGQEAVNRFFAVPVFALIGTVLPFEGWLRLGWSGVLLAVAVLLFRRLPVLLALAPLMPGLKSKREAAFVGWFGPVAIAAVYYASMMEERLGDPVIWEAVSLIVFASAVVHGVTAAPLTRRMRPDP